MKTIFVTGAAGFIGGNLCRRLLNEGHAVVGLDNFYSSQSIKIKPLRDKFPEKFMFVEADIRRKAWIKEVLSFRPDEIYHLACPASPTFYSKDPLFTLETCIEGTRHCLELNRETGGRCLLASTSEVYGDPKTHPQNEKDYGNVNTWGPRACYDEGKRVAETLSYLAETVEGQKIRVARIFNTYGPGMLPTDGRVITAFFEAAKKEKPYPIFGDGLQTRSFCFIDDLIEGLIRLMESSVLGPTNLGNPTEITIENLSKKVHELFGHGKYAIECRPFPQNDPIRRRPDISKAKKELNWEPKISLDDGLKQMWSE